MGFDDWIAATIRILERDGEPLLPTVADLTTRRVRVLQGVPDDVSQTVALQDWMTSLGAKDCFFAVTEIPGKIVVGELCGEAVVFAAIDRSTIGWTYAQCSVPSWWRSRA
jgi:hypothetical protein